MRVWKEAPDYQYVRSSPQPGRLCLDHGLLAVSGELATEAENRLERDHSLRHKRLGQMAVLGTAADRIRVPTGDQEMVVGRHTLVLMGGQVTFSHRGQGPRILHCRDQEVGLVDQVVVLRTGCCSLAAGHDLFPSFLQPPYLLLRLLPLRPLASRRGHRAPLAHLACCKALLCQDSLVEGTRPFLYL